MKRYAILILALCSAWSASTAQTPQMRRSEFVTFDTRRDALAGDRSKTQRYFAVEPASEGSVEAGELYAQSFDIPASWNDYNTYLHLENVGSAYTLAINGQTVAEVEDDRTPADFLISPWLQQGSNTLSVILRPSRHPELQEGIPMPQRPRFDGSYVFAQRKLHVYDFKAAIVPDSTEKYGIFRMDVIAANDFNYDETIAIGYDIYSPEGKLIDYGVREMTLAGRSRDTLHVKADIYGAYTHKWGGNRGEAPLYPVMLYVKRNGMIYEYIPFKAGFGVSELENGRIVRFGKPIDIVRQRYNAAADRTTTAREIAAMKKQGVNTLIPDFPQPEWFYDECDRAGIYVIDRANINAPHNAGDRSVGGTPSNDPALLDEYIGRIDAMYFRVNNHPCVIGFMLGGESGNGYNMYKAYEHLKSLEERRPVIYENSFGEWNSDM